MFIGIMIIYAKIGSFQYDDVFRGIADGVLSGNLLTAAGITLFFGAVGKSAQFPLHVWLPDAMEGRRRFRPDPCGDDGRGGRLHGRPPLPRLSPMRCSSSPTSGSSPP